MLISYKLFLIIVIEHLKFFRSPLSQSEIIKKRNKENY